jgi:hypothetical protein
MDISGWDPGLANEPAAVQIMQDHAEFTGSCVRTHASNLAGSGKTCYIRNCDGYLPN